MLLPSFKPSSIVLLLAGIPMLSQAALYTVKRVDNAPVGQSAMATAISPSGSNVAIDTFSGPTGVDFAEELPFMIDMEHFVNSYDDIYNYCVYQLNYSTCDVWANGQYYGVKSDGQVCDIDDVQSLCKGGYEKQLQAWTNGYTSNQISSTIAQPFVNPFVDTPPTVHPTGTLVSDSTDVVVNAIDDAGTAIGASSSPYFLDNGRYARAFIRRGFIGNTMLLPPASLNTKWQSFGQTNAYGKINIGGSDITYGSASVVTLADPANGNKTPQDVMGTLNECLTAIDPLNTRNCQYLQFANQASVWLNTDNVAIPIASFPAGNYGNGDETSQAAIQDAANVNNQVMLAGFSTFNESSHFYANAVIFKQNTLDLVTCLKNTPTTCWNMVRIPGVEVKQGDDIIFSYTKATGINDKGIVIGEAKNTNPINGSLAKYIYVYDSNSNSNASIIGASNSPLFFTGYNATAASINTNGEVVGKVDIENSRDRERRQRAYIYLHSNSTALLEKFNHTRGWLLDDLTNDGVVSGAGIANEYRIAEAFDINDAGDIAASAFYCKNGYETLAKNARCASTEELVAVKLTSINGSIQARSEEEEAISRSGGAFGWATLSLLFLAGLYRRKKA